jgi:hypothetical protein
MANEIKLSAVRSALKGENGSISFFCKQCYNFECKELKQLLPTKKELLSITATICKEMGVGEEYKVTIKGEEKVRVRKPSFDIVVRFLVRHQNDLSTIIAAAKPAKEEEKNEEKAAA